MGLFTRDIKTMDDLFVHQLQDIYYAEKQLVKALPKMAEKANDKAASEPESPNFRRHVVALLGRLGCNGRSCHGSFQGQGGFRLSMFGFDFADG